MDATAGRLFGTIGLPGGGVLQAAPRDSDAACASWRFSLSALERKKAVGSRR